MNATAPRRSRAALVPAVLCLAALATLGFPGCPEDVTGPTKGGSSSGLTMSNLWPNDDGRFWRYMTYSRPLEPELFEYLPPNSTVPEITLGAARALLAQPVTVWGGVTEQYQFQMQFVGMMTTNSGVTAQNLLESYPDIVLSVASLTGSAFPERLRDRIAEARPDLRARLGRPGADETGNARGWAASPLFIHGYAWSKTTARIGTYGDVDTLLAWKFLESNIHPGHTFRHQLVPSLASGIWLLASIERVVAVDLPDGVRASNALEVLYVVDYGVGVAVDAMGNVTGQYRQFDYGKVVYVPGVGPVSDIERRMAFLGANMTRGIHELELRLLDTGLAPVMLAGARQSR